MTKLKKAIAYFEDAIQESDEIIAECSEKLQKELIEQKKHFEVVLETMKKCTWIPISERLPENGQDVLVYWDDGPHDCIQIHILTYFKKGAVMDTTIQNKEDPVGKKLYDLLYNPDTQIKAPDDGFYIYDCVKGVAGFRKHADIITHWMPLPDPPKSE